MFFGRILQVCLSRCCICFTHMLHVFYLDVAYDCNDFQVFLGVFFKCFRSMLQVFQLPSDYVATVVFECFKSLLGVASLFPTFCCIVSVCPLHNADRVSMRHHCQVLPNRRCHMPFPSYRSGDTGPTCSAKRRATRGCPSRHPGTGATKYNIHIRTRAHKSLVGYYNVA